ncbi:MAG: penicillin-binding protein 2 [Patescibacteria group bacterium]|jgi:cell division protein FtsI/penicillin-binding protein 2
MVSYRKRRESTHKPGDRLKVLTIVLSVFALALVTRLGHIQIFQHTFYVALAQDQHELSEHLLAERGEIFVREDGKLFPLAANKDVFLVYAVPRNIEDPELAATKLSELLTLEKAEVLTRLTKNPEDSYEPIKKQVEKEVVEQIKALDLKGIGFERETNRLYPEKNIGSHVLGFVGFNNERRVGQYGLEGYWNTQLAGKNGFLQADRDATGRWITVGSTKLEEKQDGDSIILTIDRTIQYKACSALDEAVAKHGATGGSLVIMEPSTGKILALCGAPDFDPNAYNEVEDVNVFLNPATYDVYEPGSVFKPITMAAAMNEGKVTPTTTYDDTGNVKIGSYTIRNSDGKANGISTMTEVLEKSLNTGAIFAAEQIGEEKFEEYVKKFGFGEKTGIEIDSEQAGDISSLAEHKEIYMATGSYGQGITVNTIQLLAAYGALANHGLLMKPYIVDEVMRPDGTSDKRQPESVRQVVTPETAAKISAMLANVVQNGHGQRAGVPGYFVAGKTGTAQIPLQGKRGYDPNQTIGSFVGFAPVDDPQFVMIARIDRPQDVQFAESSAAPLFGQIAAFMLPYLGVAPTESVDN